MEVIEIEDSPSDNDQRQTIEMKHRRRYFIFDAQYCVFLQHHNEPEIDTPDDEVPACAMPHTREKPYHEDVDRLMAAVATHGNVNIIAEETTQ